MSQQEHIGPNPQEEKTETQRTEGTRQAAAGTNPATQQPFSKTQQSKEAKKFAGVRYML